MRAVVRMVVSSDLSHMQSSNQPRSEQRVAKHANDHAESERQSWKEPLVGGGDAPGRIPLDAERVTSGNCSQARRVSTLRSAHAEYAPRTCRSGCADPRGLH